MEKKIFLYLLVLFSHILNAQIIDNQSFDANLGWSSTTAGTNIGTTVSAWEVRTAGIFPTCSPWSGAGMACFKSYDILANNTGVLTSPALSFIGASYRVKFKMYRDPYFSGYPDQVQIYYNTTSDAGGTLIGTVNRSIYLAPIVSTSGWYSYSFDIPGTLTGIGYINIMGVSGYGNNIYLDELSIEQIPLIDAKLSSFDLSEIVLSGSTSISGTIENIGITAITSFDVNWQADSGTIYTQTITGQNITTGQNTSFTHTTPWNAIPGNHTLKLWLSNINGDNTEYDVTNNVITKLVSVPSGTVARLPLFEKFSSSTCSPCAYVNTNYYTPFVNSHPNEFAKISYEVYWPNPGDPYYTAEVGTRVDYYEVSFAPCLIVDSVVNSFNPTLLQPVLTAELASPAYFSIDADASIVGSDLTVNVSTNPFVSGTYNMYIAVVENKTTGNMSTNGETEFHNVFMKMLPDVNGASINFNQDVINTTTYQANLSGLHIEELSDLEVVVFIQNPINKKIMQSKVASALLSNNEVKDTKLRLYPNPSSGIVTISSDSKLDIQITDVLGKLVYSTYQLSGEHFIDLSQLEKGLYLVKMKNEKGAIQTEKIFLK